MSIYKELETKYSIKDVLTVNEYSNKTHQMSVASEELYRLKCQIKGRDLIPSYDAVRFWPITISAYSLLEQCLKLLVSIRTPNYLIAKGQAFKDGHDLIAVFDRLTELDKDLLEQCYVEYASFIEFPMQLFPTLEAYLKKIGKGQITWRYFLLESQPEDLSKLPAPLSLDILLEVTRGIISILMAKAFTDHGLNTIHRRLEHSLERALCHPAPLVDLSTDDFNDWIRQNNGIINAFSRYIRIGDLDEYDKPMRKWLEESVELLRKNRLDDLELEQFFLLAENRYMRWDGKQFRSRNPLPKPVSSLDVHSAWSIEWRSDTSEWHGKINKIEAIPMKVGQSLNITWAGISLAPPTDGDIALNSCGLLTIRRNSHVLISMNAKVIMLGCSDSDHDTYRVVSVTFIRVGEDPSSEDKISIIENWTCGRCQGTGFCEECKGEASDQDVCRSCSSANGICPDCRGYGRDGDYLLAQSIES